MQKVSKAYRDSMKSSLRERAYIMLSFGLINQEAQAKATVEDGDFAYYANAKNVLGEKSDDSNMKVNIYRHTVNFNQSFSGKVTARRVGGAKYGLANP